MISNVKWINPENLIIAQTVNTMKLKHDVGLTWLLSLLICLPIAGVAGCTQSTETRKLEPKSDVDWDAIRARDEGMADNSDPNEQVSE
ncbi:hypothetical protein RMSM_01281 [Rhodopirellula maiorica SM1]|uniref:Uncharacterized protein n=1 Tax=Rhodopirellula maiorica SM1 TaxID=1265738 RepID=M5RRA2_9BACT|nr:hypothetical protein RMSM_01281 [Rhodopirellula maiorica SM1]